MLISFAVVNTIILFTRTKIKDIFEENGVHRQNEKRTANYEPRNYSLNVLAFLKA